MERACPERAAGESKGACRPEPVEGSKVGRGSEAPSPAPFVLSEVEGERGSPVILPPLLPLSILPRREGWRAPARSEPQASRRRARGRLRPSHSGRVRSPLPVLCSSNGPRSGLPPPPTFRRAQLPLRRPPRPARDGIKPPRHRLPMERACPERAAGESKEGQGALPPFAQRKGEVSPFPLVPPLSILPRREGWRGGQGVRFPRLATLDSQRYLPPAVSRSATP